MASTESVVVAASTASPSLPSSAIPPIEGELSPSGSGRSGVHPCAGGSSHWCASLRFLERTAAAMTPPIVRAANRRVERRTVLLLGAGRGREGIGPSATTRREVVGEPWLATISGLGGALIGAQTNSCGARLHLSAHVLSALHHTSPSSQPASGTCEKILGRFGQGRGSITTVLRALTSVLLLT